MEIQPETQRQLPNKQNQSLQKQNQQDKNQLTLFGVFRFAQSKDIMFMVLGGIGAIAAGAGLPAFAFIWGRTINSFGNQNQEELVQQTRSNMLLFIYVGLGIFVAGFFMYGFWTFSSERQGNECRKLYVKALLQQQIGWYDLQNQADLASKFGRDTISFQNGIGVKIAVIIFVFSSLISGFLFAFITGWRLSLVIIAMLPAIGIVGGIANQIIIKKDKVQKSTYEKAGGRASQALIGIKTVKSLIGEQYQSYLYHSSLIENKGRLLKYGFLIGGSWGMVNSIIFFFYALGFWYGMKCITGTDECPQKYTVGDVLTVIFGIMIAGFNFSQLGPALQKITQGRQAAKRIFSVIDRTPKIRNPQNPIKLESIKGQITFQNVTFAYPKSKSNNVLNNISFQMNEKNIGLVGESGCGKSTIIQLIMRFYDPDSGKILLDGHDIKQFDLQWLRSQIGYVGQQPVLFATSIKQNIMISNTNSNTQDIQNALKKAQAWQFTNQLQNKIETYVGDGGNQLSGGQKQRIAIARALIKKPKFLLLDQATSALDRRNEKLIQKTLNQLSKQQITISIAHRTKTLLNTDVVFVIDEGRCIQKGKFSQLQRFKNVKVEQQEFDNSQTNIEQELKKQKSSTSQNSEKISEKQINIYNGSIYRRIFGYASNMKIVFILALIFAAANGIIYPLQSILLGQILFALAQLTFDPLKQDKIQIVEQYTLYYVYIAIASFVFATAQSGLFSWISLSITQKIRNQTYSRILLFPVAWFDLPQNNAGKLTTFLSADCSLIQSLITGAVSVIFQNISTIITALIIGFSFQWRTTLVTLVIMPFIALAGGIQIIFQTSLDDKSSHAYNQSSSLLMEFIINIRTITSFNLQKYFLQRYKQKIREPEKLTYKKGLIIGSAFGIGQFVFYASFGLLFFLGSIFVRDNQGVQTPEMFNALFALMFAGLSIGNSVLFLPDIGAAQVAAKNIFSIIDLPTEPQIQKKQNSKMICRKIKGKIHFKDVSFKYQNRKQYVFNDFSIKFEPGQKLGLVGKSGCGKSTILQLILRFYNIQSGQIFIDDINIKDYDLKCLRRQIGYVQQQPMLFQNSFRQNIKYNCFVSQFQIRQAARNANAYDFIMNEPLKNKLNQKIQKQQKSLNFFRKLKITNRSNYSAQNFQGYDFDRSVGIKGSHISGGQKQRIAIARAIIRQPKILLLDQATSALDSQNQMIVQQSVDQIMKNKGILSVAHRIDTIKNSNKIIVFQKGKVVQQGNFVELLKLQGYFYKLQKGIQFI